MPLVLIITCPGVYFKPTGTYLRDMDVRTRVSDEDGLTFYEPSRS
jgi:hypothetical protein